MTNCPQGQICLNKNFVIMIILLIIGLIVLGYLQNTQRDLFSLKKKIIIVWTIIIILRIIPKLILI